MQFTADQPWSPTTRRHKIGFLLKAKLLTGVTALQLEVHSLTSLQHGAFQKLMAASREQQFALLSQNPCIVRCLSLFQRPYHHSFCSLCSSNGIRETVPALFGLYTASKANTPNAEQCLAAHTRNQKCLNRLHHNRVKPHIADFTHQQPQVLLWL